MDYIYRMSTAGGMTSDTRYPNMLTNYGDFGALQRIGSVAPTSGTTVVFNNIPQTFQDLMIVEYDFFASGADQIIMTTNLGGAYSNTNLWGNGSSVFSTRFTGVSGVGTSPGSGNNNTFPISTVRHILNYANTSTFKTILQRSAQDQNGSGTTWLTVGMQQSTGAITSLTFTLSAGFASGSRISLYGIKASAA